MESTKDIDVITSYRFRLCPTTSQENRMNETLGICRDLYNHFVYESRLAYREGYKLQFDELQRIIPTLTEGKEIHSKTAQIIIRQFYNNLTVLKSLRNKGIHTGVLRFKSKTRFQSFTYNQSGFWLDLKGSILKLSKIGKIKILIHRKLSGIIKEIHIKKELSGKWFASIVVDTSEKCARFCNLQRKKIIGIDVGLRTFVCDSNGNMIKHPKMLYRSEKKMRKTQHVLSRKIKGSSNRFKQRLVVAKIHEKITNQRNDFLHKLSIYYIKNYDTIFVEDLQIENMKRNHHMSKSISDSAWGLFFKKLEYKAARAGILFRKVIPHGTSQKCSKCGKTIRKTLAIRTHCCPFCGLVMDRDYNAALNIRTRGMDSLPPEWREVTPVENRQILVVTQQASQFQESGNQ